MTHVFSDVFLKEVLDWFALIKAPNLKEKIDMLRLDVESNKELIENQRKLLGFILFSYSMNHGPTAFFGIEKMVAELKVEKEFSEYAQDWIDYSKKSKPTTP